MNNINFFLIFVIILSLFIFIFYYNCYLNEHFNDIYYKDNLSLLDNNLFNKKLNKILLDKIQNNADLQKLSNKKYQLQQYYNSIIHNNNLLKIF